MTQSLSKRQGFTLVELLVVIAIIGILAALVVPGLMSTQKKAQQTVCSNHLKGLYTAAFSYSLGKNAFPFAGTEKMAHESLNLLVNSSAGEELKPETFFCPEGEATKAETDADGNFVLREGTCSYTWVSTRTKRTGRTRALSCDKYISGDDVEYSDGRVHEGHSNVLMVLYTDNAVKPLDIKGPERDLLNDDYLPPGLVR